MTASQDERREPAVVSPNSLTPLLAIFVGGKSLRMGKPKGLLTAPGGSEPLLEAQASLARRLGWRAALIGDAAPYLELARGVPRVDDDPRGGGPLAGARAAAKHALATGHGHFIALACDMPYVTARALEQLWSHASPAVVVAPRLGPSRPWEPMLARYDAARMNDVLDEATVGAARSFQRLFSMVEVEPLPMSPAIERALRDWDTPADIEP